MLPNSLDGMTWLPLQNSLTLLFGPFLAAMQLDTRADLRITIRMNEPASSWEIDRGG